MSSAEAEPEAVVIQLLAAFSAADFERMEAVLAPDLLAFITNEAGGEDEVRGRDAYLARIEAMDLPAVRFSVELTQSPVIVGEGLVLAMVEVRAARGDRRLHNYAAHLMRVAGGEITEWRMVEAKPAESDAFWS
jgi:ketosteroid isomerase-like protein